MQGVVQCVDCNRVFDLLDPADLEEWQCGHDCEAQYDYEYLFDENEDEDYD